MNNENTVQLIEQPTLNHSKSIKNIAAKMVKIMNEVGYVKKQGKVEIKSKSGYTSSYNVVRDADVVAKCQPALVKHNIAVFPETLDCKVIPPTGTAKTYSVFVKNRITFVDADSGEYFITSAYGGGTDYQGGDKAVSKAITTACKYIFLKTFVLETGDDEEDEKMHERTINAMSKEDLYKELERCANLGGTHLRNKYVEIGQVLGKEKIRALVSSKEIDALDKIRLAKDKAEEEKRAAQCDEDVPFE